MSLIIFEMALRILLKIGRCDIQVRKSNLGYVLLSKPHCSSVVTERSPKKALLAILFPSNGMYMLLHTHIIETLMYFNMAHQVNKKKTYQQFQRENKIL